MIAVSAPAPLRDLARRRSPGGPSPRRAPASRSDLVGGELGARVVAQPARVVVEDVLEASGTAGRISKSLSACSWSSTIANSISAFWKTYTISGAGASW